MVTLSSWFNSYLVPEGETSGEATGFSRADTSSTEPEAKHGRRGPWRRIRSNLLPHSQTLSALSLSFLTQPGYSAILQPHHTPTVLASNECVSMIPSCRAVLSQPGVKAVQRCC